jgi:hypothetical protein
VVALPSRSPGPPPGTNIAAEQHNSRVRTKIRLGPDRRVVTVQVDGGLKNRTSTSYARHTHLKGDETQLFPDLRYVINPSRRVEASARQAASVRSHQQVHDRHLVVMLQPVTKSVAQTMFTVSRYGASQMHGSTRTHERQGYCDFRHHCRRRIDDARCGRPRCSGATRRTGPLSIIRDSACRLRH